MPERLSRSYTYAIDSTLADTPVIEFGPYEYGLIALPSGTSTSALTFYAAATKDGTYLQIYNSSNAAVSRTVAASRVYALPDECRGAQYLKIVGDADETSAELSLKT